MTTSKVLPKKPSDAGTRDPRPSSYRRPKPSFPSYSPRYNMSLLEGSALKHKRATLQGAGRCGRRTNHREAIIQKALLVPLMGLRLTATRGRRALMWGSWRGRRGTYQGVEVRCISHLTRFYSCA